MLFLIEIVPYQTYSSSPGTISRVKFSGLLLDYVAPGDNKDLSLADNILEPNKLPMHVNLKFSQSSCTLVAGFFSNVFLTSVTFSSVTDVRGHLILSASFRPTVVMKTINAVQSKKNVENYQLLDLNF